VIENLWRKRFIEVVRQGEPSFGRPHDPTHGRSFETDETRDRPARLRDDDLFAQSYPLEEL
jgi:hypothetical protein